MRCILINEVVWEENFAATQRQLMHLAMELTFMCNLPSMYSCDEHLAKYLIRLEPL